MKNKQLEGYRFRCQHPICRYILDFYSDERFLAIELEGDIHKERKDCDEYRDDFMKSLGITTLRFVNDQVMKDIDSVVVKIKKELTEKVKSFVPPTGDRGAVS